MEASKTERCGSRSEKQLSWIKRLITISIVVLFGLLMGIVGWKLGTDSAEERATAEQQEYLERYSASRSTTYHRLTDSWTKTLANVYGDVIFYGDSITAGGLWEEYYPYLTPVNLGVVGDTVDGLITRLPQIEMLMCEKCFVMIGVNDLINGMSVEELLSKYEQLLQRLAALYEEIGTQTYVQSVLPVREDTTSYNVYNADIRLLNEGLSALAKKYDMTWIDVHSLLAGEDGELQAKYSFDGLHLTELAYYEWQEMLMYYVDE